MFALLAWLCLLLASPLSLADSNSSSTVQGPTACSSYMGQVKLNEIRIGASGSSSTSNQIELYNSGGVSQSVWQAWQLVVYYKSGGGSISKKGGYYLSSGFTANGQFIYNSNKAIYLRNKNSRSVDIALVDKDGKLVDYVALENTIQTRPSCFGSTTTVNTTASGDTSGDVARLPDGVAWPSSVTNTSGHTMGRTNVCTSSGSDLTVSLSASTTTPIVNTTAVTFTLTVMNKSCSNTISSVSLNVGNITTGRFSGLSFSPGQGSVSQGASAITWSVGNLAAGASTTLTVTGTPTTLGSQAITAAVASPSSGLVNTSDDTATVTLNVRDFNYVDFDVTTDTLTEGEAPTYSASISASVVPSAPITINYTVTGTATSSDTDLPTSGSVTIDPTDPETPSQTSIDFNITDDAVQEPTKNIILTITSVTSADPSVKLGTNSQLAITLFDDDATLTAKYSLDEMSWSGTAGEVKDGSGNNRNGKAAGSGSLPSTDYATPALPGASGSCTYGVFAGGTSQQGVDLGTGDMGVGNASALTVAAWVRWSVDPATGNRWANIFTNSSTGSGNSGQFWLQHSNFSTNNDRFEFAVKTSASRPYVSSTTKPVAGQWYHVVGTYDGSTLKIYVNGNLENSVAGSGTIVPLVSGYQTFIGRWAYNSENYRAFQGNIDEVRLYKGALDAGQVADLYAETHTCPPTAPPAPSAMNAVNTGANAVSGKISTKVAGTGFNLDVYALNTAKTAQDSTFSGSVLVDLLANAGTGTATDSANCPTSSTSLSVGTVTLTAGKGTIAVPAVANSWRDVRVRMRAPATGTPTITACSLDNFAVKPASLVVQATDTDWATAGGGRTLAASGAGSTPTHKAGRPFTLTATGKDSAGATTSNYAGSPVASSVTALDAGASAGTFSVGGFSGSGGAVSSSTASYGDVGSVSVQFQDTGYASVDAGDTSADCSGYYVCSGSVTIGRFVPDHFSVSGGTATPACGLFNYFGQDGVATSFSLVAQDASGNTTRNYAGGLARLDLASYSALNFSATGLPGGVTFGSGATVPSGAWSAGVASPVTASQLISRPTAAMAPASISFFAQPTDLDGVSAASATALGSAVTFRYGRVRIQNAYGSQLLDLAMTMRSEHWNGTAWTFNSDDSCTDVTLALSAAGSSNIVNQTCVRDGLAASGAACSGSTASARQFKETGVAGFAGDFNLWLKAPGVPGSVDVTATVPAWLQYNWTGSVGNPRARATFGVFKSGPAIFQRENF